MTKPLIVLFSLAAMAAPAPALAAVQVWSQLETELAMPNTALWAPDALGFQTSLRFSSDLIGLERVQLRWGPRWKLTDWLRLGLNHTAYVQQPAAGVFDQEQRLELEPTVKGTLGLLHWSDRNRLEYRWRPDATRWRYRNQLRLEAPLSPGLSPFVANELFFDLGGAEINEHRASLGLTRDLEGVGWEFSYTLRTGLGSAAGSLDHLLTMAWRRPLK